MSHIDAFIADIRMAPRGVPVQPRPLFDSFNAWSKAQKVADAGEIFRPGLGDLRVDGGIFSKTHPILVRAGEYLGLVRVGGQCGRDEKGERVNAAFREGVAGFVLRHVRSFFSKV